MGGRYRESQEYPLHCDEFVRPGARNGRLSPPAVRAMRLICALRPCFAQAPGAHSMYGPFDACMSLLRGQPKGRLAVGLLAATQLDTLLL